MDKNIEQLVKLLYLKEDLLSDLETDDDEDDSDFIFSDIHSALSWCLKDFKNFYTKQPYTQIFLNNNIFIDNDKKSIINSEPSKTKSDDITINNIEYKSYNGKDYNEYDIIIKFKDPITIDFIYSYDPTYIDFMINDFLINEPFIYSVHLFNNGYFVNNIYYNHSYNNGGSDPDSLKLSDITNNYSDVPKNIITTAYIQHMPNFGLYKDNNVITDFKPAIVMLDHLNFESEKAFVYFCNVLFTRFNVTLINLVDVSTIYFNSVSLASDDNQELHNEFKKFCISNIIYKENDIRESLTINKRKLAQLNNIIS